ncbi:aldehyde dehydrogenase family protein [Thioclava electrotropha]|uniref:aldehyde dehydrogenase family protein n=1 Tax=Thioclava electrotropha TaxID=1549850 RepID=UPI0023A8ADB5|nr:aldehyde dehydrogenase family protein [Thioclava electrotropha]
MSLQPVLIAGEWRAADASSSFQSHNPATREALPDEYPVSNWSDCEAALQAAAEAAAVMRVMPGERIAAFLEAFADGIEARQEALVDMAHAETALPKSPRLADGELPRTTGQLRQAAQAARDETWRMPIIDSATNIRSCFGAIGPVAVFGPNNFPFAFGSASGGDFAAAIAAGNPVIAKANSSHPGTTRIFAEAALEAAPTRAAATGADAIVVSNHGGRQLDGALSSIRMLPKIVNAVGDKTEVWLDSGIRSGQDVLKALALGAKGVMIGRAYVYGLGAMGEPGVTKALEVIQKELDTSMALCGERRIEDLGRNDLLIPNGFFDTYS